MMVKFGELTEKQKESFQKEINKKPEKTYSEQEMMLWPEDDEDVVREYYEKEGD